MMNIGELGELVFGMLASFLKKANFFIFCQFYMLFYVHLASSGSPI